MTSRGLLDAWLKFWFAPQSPTPVALFRLCFGLLVLDAAIVHIGPDVLDWYGPHGVTSADAVHRYWWLNEPRFDMFLLAPNTDAGVMSFWYVFVAAVVCLTTGFCTRAAAIVVCLFLISMDNRQPFAINGGDAMMRLLAGYLVFAEAGAAFSIDRLIKRWKEPTFGEASRPKPVAPWGQRMIQVQMAITYWSTFCAKLSGAQWLDGTAVYYATRLDDMINHTMPLYDSLLFCKFLSWYTLFVEGAMFSLVWLRDLRYWILGATMIMHLGIDYSINLPVFEWIFMTSFIAFIYPEDLTRAMDFLKRRINTYFGPATPLLYNGAVSRQTSTASVLEGLDIFGRLHIMPMTPPDDVVAEGARSPVLVAMTAFGPLTDFQLFAWLTARLPLLWILYPLIGVPWRLSRPKQTPAVKSES
jgi:hypothetical protein